MKRFGFMREDAYFKKKKCVLKNRARVKAVFQAFRRSLFSWTLLTILNVKFLQMAAAGTASVTLTCSDSLYLNVDCVLRQMH